MVMMTILLFLGMILVPPANAALMNRDGVRSKVIHKYVDVVILIDGDGEEYITDTLGCDLLDVLWSLRYDMGWMLDQYWPNKNLDVYFGDKDHNVFDTTYYRVIYDDDGAFGTGDGELMGETIESEGLTYQPYQHIDAVHYSGTWRRQWGWHESDNIQYDGNWAIGIDEDTYYDDFDVDIGDSHAQNIDFLIMLTGVEDMEINLAWPYGDDWTDQWGGFCDMKGCWMMVNLLQPTFFWEAETYGMWSNGFGTDKGFSSIVMHEFGHQYGMDHSSVFDVMNYFWGTQKPYSHSYDATSQGVIGPNLWKHCN